MGGREFGKLSDLLERAKQHSTTVGKVLLTLMFVFRVVILVRKRALTSSPNSYLKLTNQAAACLL